MSNSGNQSCFTQSNNSLPCSCHFVLLDTLELVRDLVKMPRKTRTQAVRSLPVSCEEKRDIRYTAWQEQEDHVQINSSRSNMMQFRCISCFFLENDRCPYSEGGSQYVTFICDFSRFKLFIRYQYWCVEINNPCLGGTFSVRTSSTIFQMNLFVTPAFFYVYIYMHCLGCVCFFFPLILQFPSIAGIECSKERFPKAH